MKVSTFYFVFLFAQPARATPSKTVTVLSARDIKSYVPSALPLISKKIDEVGFASEIRISYGKYDFLRTDVSSPDGRLEILIANKKVCRIDLSLNPEIYFSGKTQVMALSAYSGSAEWFVFYKIKDENCKLLGSSGTKNYNLVKELLDNRDGSHTCGRIDRERE